MLSKLLFLTSDLRAYVCDPGFEWSRMPCVFLCSQTSSRLVFQDLFAVPCQYLLQLNEPGAHIIYNILKEAQLSHGNVSCSLVIHQVQALDGSTDKIYIFPNKTSDTQRSFITRRWKQHLCCFLLYVLWTMGLRLVKTKALQGGRQEEADGFLKRDDAIYFLRSYLRLYDFLEGKFLPLTIRVIIVSWGNCLNIKFCFPTLEIKYLPLQIKHIQL